MPQFDYGNVNPFAAVQQGIDFSQGMIDKQAQRQAGNLLAQTASPAAQPLFQSGQLDQGAKVQQYGQDQQKQALADHLAFLGKAADALSQIPDDGTQSARRTALATHIAPVLQQMGYKPQDIQALQNGDLSDQSLGMFKSKVDLEFQKVGNSVLTFNKATGAKVSQYDAPDDKTVKHDWKERVNPDGSTTWIDLNAPPTAAGAPATPGQSGPVAAQIADTATKAGATPTDVAYLQRLAQVESSANPSAKNGSSTGLFQFHPDTFASMGGTDINNTDQQTQAALLLSQANRKVLQQIGAQPTDGNAYILHQQGTAGGKALLTADPNAKAVDVLTPVYGGNANLARQAITNNGGDPNMSAGQFVGMWQKRWDAAVPAPAAPAAPAATPGTVPGSAPGTKELKGATADEDAPLSKDAIHLLAGKWLLNGQLPAGMGKQATADRRSIINEGTALANELGLTPGDLVAGTASIKALGSALGKASSIRTQVEGSEATVEKNAQQVLALAPKGGGPTGVPVLNRWIQAGRKNIAGDPDVAAFNLAIGTVADEYAKVMTTATGTGGATSDTARAEAYKRLSNDMTLPALQKTIAQMQIEMDNRTGSLRDVEAGIRTQIRSGGGTVPPPSASPAPGAAPLASGQGWKVVRVH